MKCLLVADLHYSLRQFDWVLQAASHVDVVVAAGDHLDIAGYVDGPTQIAVVFKYLRRLAERATPIVCSGNHDLDSRTDDGEKVARWVKHVPDVVCDGHSVAIGDVLFSVCAWWDGPTERVAIGDQFSRDSALEKQTWIWVYHAPPSQSPTRACPVL